MPIQVFGHGKCKATRAALRFFSERRVVVQSVDILDKGMSKGELESVIRAVGVDRLFAHVQGGCYRLRAFAFSYEL